MPTGKTCEGSREEAQFLSSMAAVHMDLVAHEQEQHNNQTFTKVNNTQILTNDIKLNCTKPKKATIQNC